MLIQKTGMAILHCHSVESPLVDWIDLGIPIGLGTDDYFHNMNDLLREQRNGQAIRGNKIGGYLGMINSSRRTTRPSFYKMLELSTIGGAKALGLQDEIGSLEEGKKADLITFNLMNPYITPTRDPITSVFLYATPGDIDNVICDGKKKKKENKLTTVELNKALLDANKTCDEIINTFFEEHPEQKRIWEEKTKQNSFN